MGCENCKRECKGNGEQDCEEIIGYCTYCHNDIKKNEAFVTIDKNKYHIDCYLLT